MGWWTTFQAQISANLGMGLEYIFPLVIALIGLVASGKDTKVASSLVLVLSAINFIILYHIGLNYLVTLLLMIASIIIMAIQMFTEYKEYGGGLV